jgi:hypothetical protein
MTVLWTLGFLLVEIFSCGTHFEYHWGPLADQAYCHGGLPFLEGLMISDFITDFIILFLPFPMVSFSPSGLNMAIELTFCTDLAPPYVDRSQIRGDGCSPARSCVRRRPSIGPAQANFRSRSLAASAARMVLQIQLAIGGYTTKTDVFRTLNRATSLKCPY